ncbi:MAG: hypothetical protein MJZ68_02145 [archaeon]|nr:hypothetical protein [archaeon]
MSSKNDYQPTYREPLSPSQKMYITPEEQAAKIDEKLKVAARRYLCPSCGHEFSLFQSRAVACKYCPKANQRCPNVRCPYCDKEYPISGFVVPGENNRSDTKIMNEYTDNIFNRWADRYNRR